jgi:hypothetical protein
MSISQREAKRLQDQVRDLTHAIEKMRADWARDYPGGVHISTIEFDSKDRPNLVAVRTARRLKHAVVVIDDGSVLRFYALPVGIEK